MGGRNPLADAIVTAWHGKVAAVIRDDAKVAAAIQGNAKVVDAVDRAATCFLAPGRKSCSMPSGRTLPWGT